MCIRGCAWEGVYKRVWMGGCGGGLVGGLGSYLNGRLDH